MPRPSSRTIKALFALSGNLCAFPSCTTKLVEEDHTVTGQICHIISRRANGPRHDANTPEEYFDSADNLILLCAQHHKVVDDNPGGFSADTLRDMRAVHESSWGRKERPDDDICAKLLLGNYVQVEAINNSGNIAVNSPGTIQANRVHLSAVRRTIKMNPPPGSIGADLERAAHIRYLINRYNEFARKEPERTRKFSFGAISRTIENKFGSQWALLPMANFDAVRKYLEDRIDRTRIAKLNASRGHQSYRSFAGRKSC